MGTLQRVLSRLNDPTQEGKGKLPLLWQWGSGIHRGTLSGLSSAFYGGDVL